MTLQTWPSDCQQTAGIVSSTHAHGFWQMSANHLYSDAVGVKHTLEGRLRSRFEPFLFYPLPSQGLEIQEMGYEVHMGVQTRTVLQEL